MYFFKSDTLKRIYINTEKSFKTKSGFYIMNYKASRG